MTAGIGHAGQNVACILIINVALVGLSFLPGECRYLPCSGENALFALSLSLGIGGIVFPSSLDASIFNALVNTCVQPELPIMQMHVVHHNLHHIPNRTRGPDDNAGNANLRKPNDDCNDSAGIEFSQRDDRKLIVPTAT